MPRTVFPSSQADRIAPALGFPADSVERGRIADDRTVWVFSDIHGLRSGLETALLEAGLMDGEARWTAPAGTALVGLGEYIYRGRDSGTVLLLDTNASARSEAQGRRAYATLARLPVGPTFEAARFITIDTSDAVDRAPRRRRTDWGPRSSGSSS